MATMKKAWCVCVCVVVMRKGLVWREKLGREKEERRREDRDKGIEGVKKREEKEGTDGEKCGSDELLLRVLRWCNCI